MMTTPGVRAALTHDPSGFRDGYATAFHISGTPPVTMELPTCTQE